MLKNKNQHDIEHRQWSRRQFLLTGGLAAAGSLFLGGTHVQASAPARLSSGLSMTDNDRVLVLINLFGGNDGLNTIIPHSEDVGRSVYESLRPSLAQHHGTHYNDNTLLSNFGDTNYALPSTMTPLMDLWNNNHMSVIQNVGYPSQNFSHFVSTQIWQSAGADAFDEKYRSGIIGRHAEFEFPAFSVAPPTIPPALQIGNVGNHIFQGMDASMGLVFNSPQSFYNLANTGSLYPTTGFSDCPQDDSRAFLRQTANNANRYAQSIIDAYQAASNNVDFPAEIENNTKMNEQLAIISRLIKGQLGTKVYLAHAQKYDTHSFQAEVHPGLLTDLANSIRAFYDDLASDGFADKVTIMVFSEFGRTIAENGQDGAEGTDHGNTAPLLLFGDGINGGFFQDPIDLSLVSNGRVQFETQPATDFRSVFATLLEQWLCVPPLAVDFVMGSHFPRIPNLIIDPCESSNDFDRAILLGHHPNPELPNTIDIKYAMKQQGVIRLKLMDTSGQELHTFFHEEKRAGSHIFQLNPDDYLLTNGEYIYQLEAGGKEYMQRLIIE